MNESAVPPSRATLLRYLIVSKVRSQQHRGVSLADAIAEVAAQTHTDLEGNKLEVSARTLYRWMAKLEAADSLEADLLAALARKPREMIRGSRVLSESLLDFLVLEKQADCKASVPELIKRAREAGHLQPKEKVCRATVNRALERCGVSLARRKGAAVRDSRRYSFAHRMECVLCDGKHFRAGEKRAKRVALFFLDDATRFALHVVVGTSENRFLFLRGLYEMIRRYGRMSVLYLDHGSAFIAQDTAWVVARLKAALVHGEVRYPEGHGKIEAFNKTAKAGVIRTLDGRLGLDPEPESLELRLGHYIRDIYNQTPHRSLGGKTPAACFFSDSRPLRPFSDDASLRDCFCVPLNRLVSKDNVISWEGTAYEMPCGYGNKKVKLIHKLLEGTIHFLHDGRFIRLHPVDPVANAHTRRDRAKTSTEETQPRPSKSAADIAFERTFAPMIDADGGFSDP